MTTTEHFVHIAPAAPPPDAAPAPSATHATTTLLPPLSWRQQLTLAWRIWRDRVARSWLALLVGALLAGGAGLLATAQAPVAGPATRAPAPTPPLAVPTGAPAAPAPAGPLLPVALVAYAAPGGVGLGALPAGVPYAVLAQAHAGAWLQIDAGSGPVWVEAAAWGGAPVVRPAALQDLTPPTPVPPPPPAPRPQIVYVASGDPGRGQPAPQLAPTPAELAPIVEAPAWHPPYASGYDPARPDCPLVLSPERLAACQRGEIP